MYLVFDFRIPIGSPSLLMLNFIMKLLNDLKKKKKGNGGHSAFEIFFCFYG